MSMKATLTTDPMPRQTGVDAGIQVSAVTKTFHDDRGREITAVDGVDLTIARGEFLVLLGPSGCGKTTLLRCLAGLEEPTEGRILFGGRPVFDSAVGINAADREVGMVFQSYALWPHMTVEQNIAYPLQSVSRGQRGSKAEIRERVAELLGLMDLAEQARRKPGQLSGGQQQRVALARAIAAGSGIVLFDEPLSNIDAKVRESLRLELRNMQRRLGFTAVYVTHDQTEAMEMADRVAVMRNGRVVQVGSPREIYRDPRTRFVAEFVGASNLLPVLGTADAIGAGGSTLDTPLGDVMVSAAPGDVGPMTLVSRAHAWWIRSTAPSLTANAWSGVVLSKAYLGWYTEFAVQVGDQVLRVWADEAAATGDIIEGDRAWIGVRPEDCLVVRDDVG
jgi:iron(III) transport system ATP-binding protein